MSTVFRMVRKRRPGDRGVIHTPSEIVRCTFDDGVVIADCTGTNAKRVLEKKGFILKEEIDPTAKSLSAPTITKKAAKPHVKTLDATKTRASTKATSARKKPATSKAKK